MADFEVRVVPALGIGGLPWVDEATVNAPSRQNLIGGLVPRYTRITVPVNFFDVEFKAYVGGVYLADAGLGGRLFFWGFAESTTPRPVMTAFAGESGRVGLRIRPVHAGHHVLSCHRPQGGSFLFPFDVEPP